MNTYRICLVLMAVLIFGCSKSSDESKDIENGPNVDADYSVLLSHSGTFSDFLLNANAELMTINPTNSPFKTTSVPDLSYREGKVLSFYKGNTACSGDATIFDFEDYSATNLVVFDDLENCELEVISIAHSASALYLAYSIPGDGLKDTHYFIRSVNTGMGESNFTDLALEKEPRQLVYSDNKVFILSAESEEENKFALVVFDTMSGLLIHDLNLDFDAQRIFKTSEGHIMVSYPELHLVVNSSTMGITTTVRYEEGKEPKFGYTAASYLDTEGNLYYAMPTELAGTDYANIPGVYDFSTNTAILYFYENFLTETERDFEFEIGDTSMVSYDSGNNLILIGYQKSDNPNKGGILRIKPIPEPAFIDNIDLEGVPFDIFVN